LVFVNINIINWWESGLTWALFYLVEFENWELFTTCRLFGRGFDTSSAPRSSKAKQSQALRVSA